MTDTFTEATINGLLTRAHSQQQTVHQQLRVRRALINRFNTGVDDSSLGTLIPPPFHKTQLAIKTMIGAPMEAAQHYVSRIAGNRPDIRVVPISAKSEVGVAVEKHAGEQERLSAQLWEEMGGGEAQNACAWAQTVGGAGYYLVLPRDASFGLPDRMYFADSDETALLVAMGKLSPAKRETRQGQVVYAEAGDVWAGRRKEAAKQRAIAGTSLFTLRAFPRDMVLRERDGDGIKWACVIEEIASDKLQAGSELARSAAKMDGIAPEDMDKFGLIWERGKIIGGISLGVPENSNNIVTFSLIRFFTRTEQIVMVGAAGNAQGGRIVYRGEHGCTRNGIPECPVHEVAFMRTDTEVPGHEFATPLSQVLAYVPLINQIETLRSNATAYNLLPRWVVELKDGSILRNEDGEPVIVSNEATPGLDPSQAAAYPGTLRQLKIETADSDELLKIYLEQLMQAMPSQAAQGQGGSSEAAWHAHQMIQQSQQNIRQPVDNHARTVKAIMQQCYGWLRQLDQPVYFYASGSTKSGSRSVRGLIEFDPKDLTDSIMVTQELDTPEDAVVRIQVGMEQHAQGYIDDETYYSEWAKVQDSRQAVIDKYVQQVVNHVMGAVPAAPGSVIAMVADSVRGRLTYQLLQRSPNFAIASAEQAVMQAGMQGQPYAQPPGQPGQAQQSAPGAPAAPANGGPAQAAGVRQPGLGMAPTLQGQLGSAVPGRA